jgi:hypothetical protein
LLFASLISLILTSLSFSALERFLPAGVFSCMEPRAELLALSLGVSLALQVFLARRLLSGWYFRFLVGHGVLILLAVWLGAYAVSPLGYSTGRIPNLHGFTIIRSGRSSIVLHDEIVSLKAGAAVGIEPLLLDATSKCMWISAAGAAMDDPSSCSTVYEPPNGEHDVLRVRVRSACGLPDAAGRIQISILP